MSILFLIEVDAVNWQVPVKAMKHQGYRERDIKQGSTSLRHINREHIS